MLTIPCLTAAHAQDGLASGIPFPLKFALASRLCIAA
jgi:hypothetical protein